MRYVGGGGRGPCHEQALLPQTEENQVSTSTCPHCHQPIEATPDTAPGTYDCPYCGKPFQWPLVPSAPFLQSGAFVQGQPDTGTLLNLKLVGIFNIVCGGLSAAWALLMLLETCLAPIIAEQETNPPPTIVIALMFGGMFLLAAAAAVVQITAGIKVLRRSRRARTWGIVAGVVSCIQVCGCCIYPLTLAGGIFTLVIMFGEKAKRCLD